MLTPNVHIQEELEMESVVLAKTLLGRGDSLAHSKSERNGIRSVIQFLPIRLQLVSIPIRQETRSTPPLND